MLANILSEFLGTAFLVMIVLGSGIMGATLFPNQSGLALLANSIATGAGLFALIQCLGTISGAHFNPVVSLVEMLWGRLQKKHFLPYIMAQMIGAYAGILITHAMFQMEVFQISQVERSGAHLWLSEVIATFGLIAIVGLAGKKRVEHAPMSVALYITAGYWFTSSTGFVNPAVTFARLFTNSFGGMSPEHYLPYTISQIAGALLAFMVLKGIEQRS